MKLDNIHEQWDTDSRVDLTTLSDHALQLALLHSKYHRILSNERLVALKMETDLKKLKLDKYEFYAYGPTEEQIALGWKLPPRGKIIKSEIPSYLDADSDIIEMNLRIGYQYEKINLLESIIKTLHNRGFHLKTAVDYERLKQGV